MAHVQWCYALPVTVSWRLLLARKYSNAPTKVELAKPFNILHIFQHTFFRVQGYKQYSWIIKKSYLLKKRRRRKGYYRTIILLAKVIFLCIWKQL